MTNNELNTSLPINIEEAEAFYNGQNSFKRLLTQFFDGTYFEHIEKISEAIDNDDADERDR